MAKSAPIPEQCQACEAKRLESLASDCSAAHGAIAAIVDWVAHNASTNGPLTEDERAMLEGAVLLAKAGRTMSDAILDKAGWLEITLARAKDGEA